MPRAFPDEGTSLDPDGGLKRTGRAGRFAVGVLGIRQQAQQSSGSSDLFVMRLSAKILGESSLGLPARRGWQANLSVKEVQADNFPALGFVNGTGIREGDLELGYSWRPSGHLLRSITSSVAGWRVPTIDGELQSQQLTIKPLELENQAGEYFALDFRRQRERLDAPFEISAGVVIPVGDDTFDSHCANATTGQHRDLSGKLFACDGDFYDGMRASAGGGSTPTPQALTGVLRYDSIRVCEAIRRTGTRSIDPGPRLLHSVPHRRYMRVHDLPVSAHFIEHQCHNLARWRTASLTGLNRIRARNPIPVAEEAGDCGVAIDPNQRVLC